MAWIEVHTVVVRHRKVKELAIALGIKSVYAKSHLVSLWLAALEQQEDGDLRKWSDQFLAEAAEFDGDAAKFRALLEGHGWLDNGLIHDWLDYAGRFLRGKYAGSNIQRLKEIWAVHGRRYGKPTRNQHKTNKNPTTPNLTVPNLTKPTIPIGAFEILWAKYPRRLGRREAERHFKATVKTNLDWLDINMALENYQAHLRRERVAPEFVKHGSTWLNNWRDWVDFKGPLVPPPESTAPTVISLGAIERLRDPEAREAAMRLREDQLREAAKK